MDYELYNGTDPLDALLGNHVDHGTQVNNDDDIHREDDNELGAASNKSVCERSILHNEKIDLDDLSSISENARIKHDKAKIEIHPYHYTGPYIKPVKPTIKKSFRCPYDTCLRRFAIEAGYKSHLALHSKNEFVCELCHKVYRDKNLLLKHESKHRDKDGNLISLPCRINGCEHREVSLALLEKHKILEHNGSSQEYNCEICLQKFKSRIQYVSHASKHKFNNVGEIPCMVCGKVFKSVGLRNRHSSVHCNNKVFVCELCGLEFSRSDNLQRHKIIHEGKNFFCKICFADFSHESSLTKHMRQHPNARKKHVKRNSKK